MTLRTEAKAHSRLIAEARTEAKAYERLLAEARALGIPTSLDDPRSPRTVAALEAAVKEARA